MGRDFNNLATTKSGDAKERIVLDFLSKRYNVKKYYHNYYEDDFGSPHYDQDYIYQNKKYKCPDLYILEDGNGNNIVFRIEVKGSHKTDNETFPGFETLVIEKYKFDSYLSLFQKEEIESCVVFVIGNENYEKLDFYWERTEKLSKIKSRKGIKYGKDCLFWRVCDMKAGIDSFLDYVDDYLCWR